MLFKGAFNISFHTNSIIIEYDSIPTYIEWQFFNLYVSKKDRRLLESMGITEFIEYIRIFSRCYIGHNNI